MGIAERKGRERSERQQRIIAAARAIAESEGWTAVTIRRLADEIEHSQPVLYSHFKNRDAIVAAVAIEGFRELASALRDATRETDDRLALSRFTAAYLAFALAHPAVYDAMFTLPTALQFGEPDTKSELKDSFAALVAVISPSRKDFEVAAETFWAALHGLVVLERSGRIRHEARDARISFIGDVFAR